MTTIHTESSLRDDLKRDWEEVRDADAACFAADYDVEQLIRGRKTGQRIVGQLDSAIVEAEQKLTRLKAARATALGLWGLADATTAKEVTAPIRKNTECLAGFTSDLNRNAQAEQIAAEARSEKVVAWKMKPRLYEPAPTGPWGGSAA